jgi:hypothetical protein
MKEEELIYPEKKTDLTNSSFPDLTLDLDENIPLPPKRILP